MPCQHLSPKERGLRAVKFTPFVEQPDGLDRACKPDIKVVDTNARLSTIAEIFEATQSR